MELPPLPSPARLRPHTDSVPPEVEGCGGEGQYSAVRLFVSAAQRAWARLDLHEIHHVKARRVGHLLHRAQYAFERRLPRCGGPDPRCGFEPRGQRERTRREGQQQRRDAVRKPTAHDERADPRHCSPQHQRRVTAHPAAIGERDARDLAGNTMSPETYSFTVTDDLITVTFLMNTAAIPEAVA